MFNLSCLYACWCIFERVSIVLGMVCLSPSVISKRKFQATLYVSQRKGKKRHNQSCSTISITFRRLRPIPRWVSWVINTEFVLEFEKKQAKKINGSSYVQLLSQTYNKLQSRSWRIYHSTERNKVVKV
jgi:hypothetical protein